jgi:hypothetical protein
MWTCMRFHSSVRKSWISNSPPGVKLKDFVSKAIRTGLFLRGCTTKRDSMWHSPVFTCIRANGIPVEIYNKMGMNYAVRWMQIVCLNFLFRVITTVLMNNVSPTFKWRSSSQILFGTARVFVSDKYRQIVKCLWFLDSAWERRIVRECLVHYAASLDVESWFSISENKMVSAVLPKFTRNIPATLVDSSDWVITES